MGWIGCARCKIFRCYFVARTFALVRLIFHRDSKGNQTVLIAPKWSEKHQNMSLGSNGVEWVRSFRKIPTLLRGTNFCLNCASSAHFQPSFVRQRNYLKCTQTAQNAPKHEFRVKWSGSGALVAKNSDTTSWHELLH